MKIRVDGAMCTGHGRCYTLEPAVFGPDEEGYNRDRDVIIDVEPEREKGARRGVRVCPEGAITVVEQ